MYNIQLGYFVKIKRLLVDHLLVKTVLKRYIPQTELSKTLIDLYNIKRNIQKILKFYWK